MKIPHLLLSLIISFSCLGQEYHKIKIDKYDKDFKPNIERVFFISNFIDGRADTSSVGIVQKGLMNKKVEAVLNGGTITYFNNLLFLNLYGINMDNKMRPIVAVLKEIKVSEWTTFSSERGMLEMTLAFFEKDSTNILKPIFESEIIEENGGIADVTGAHSSRIKDGLLKSLNEVNKYLLNPDGKIPSYSDADLQFDKFIEKAGLKIKNYPEEKTIEDNIFTCTNKRYGLFKNRDEMLQNRPSIVENFELEYFDQNKILTIRSVKNQKLLKGNYWGFSDGKDFYIYSQNYQPNRHFCKIEEYGTIWAWQDNYYDANDMAIQAGFGLIGLAIGNAIKDKDCMFLNPTTGLISHANPKTLTKLLEKEPSLLSEYNNVSNKRNLNYLLSLLKRYNSLSK